MKVHKIKQVFSSFIEIKCVFTHDTFWSRDKWTDRKDTRAKATPYNPHTHSKVGP